MCFMDVLSKPSFRYSNIFGQIGHLLSCTEKPGRSNGRQDSMLAAEKPLQRLVEVEIILH